MESPRVHNQLEQLSMVDNSSPTDNALQEVTEALQAQERLQLKLKRCKMSQANNPKIDKGK